MGGLGRGTMMMDDAGDAPTPAEEKIVQNARTVAARDGSLDVHEEETKTGARSMVKLRD